MKKLSILIVGSAFAISGIFGVLTTPQLGGRGGVAVKEVPDRPTHRGPASNEEGSTSQPSALSIRPAANVTKGLNISESQIQLMETHLEELQKDVSLFKDTHGWVVRFHHPSPIMSALGVKDRDLITFKHLQEMKDQPALESLIQRLEAIFAQLQK